MQTKNRTFDAARRYLDYGWPVIPLTPHNDTGFPEEQRGKRPLLRKWERYCTEPPDAEEICTWWTQTPGANVGVACGPAGGVLILDVDGPEGEASLEGKELPETPIVRTGSGGKHYYFRYPPDIECRNRKGFLLGLDIRAKGGQGVLPPSVHISGHRYTWEVAPRGLYPPESGQPEEDLAEMPAWLLDAARKPEHKSAVPAPEKVPAISDRVVRASKYLEKIPGAVSGKGGHNQTWSAALNIVRGFDLPPDVGFDLLLREYNPRCDPPWTEQEIKHKVEDVAGSDAQTGYLLVERASTGRHHQQAKGEKPSSSPIYTNDDDDGPITFHPVSFSHVLATAPDVDWLVSQILPTGTSAVLGGQPGKGKSWLLGDLAIAVATGTPWLGKYETQQGDVLVIDQENSLPLLRRRGLKLFRGRNLPKTSDLPIEYLVNSGLNLSDSRHVAGLEALLKARKPALVLIDSLVRVHRASENSATEMAAVFAEIKGLMDTHGCVFLSAHHSRKLGMYNDAGQMLHGSSEIVAFCDTYLFLRQGKDGLRVEHNKSRYGEPVPDFIIEITDPPDMPDSTIVKYVGEPGADAQGRQQEAERFALGVLAEGELRRQEILNRGKGRKLSENAIDKALKGLVETKQVQRSQRGREVFFALKNNPHRRHSIYNDDDGLSDGPDVLTLPVKEADDLLGGRI